MHSEVKKYLEKTLLGTHSDSNKKRKINAFINKLFEDYDNTDAIRMAYCIAIDILNNLLAADHYKEIFCSDYCDIEKSKEPDICKIFHCALENNSNYRTFSRYSSKIYSFPKKLVTVIQSVSFAYYFGSQFNPKITDIDSIDYKMFLSKLEKRPQKREIMKWPDGKLKKYFWTLPLYDLEQIIENAVHDKSLQVVKQLGLVPDYIRAAGSNPQYFFCIYPDDFLEKNVLYQPNATNANWCSKNGLFLSYIEKDGWGRTYPTFGISETDYELKEGIHNMVSEINVSINYLGEIDKRKQVSPNVNKLIVRAKERFNAN